MFPDIDLITILPQTMDYGLCLFTCPRQYVEMRFQIAQPCTAVTVTIAKTDLLLLIDYNKG